MSKGIPRPGSECAEHFEGHSTVLKVPILVEGTFRLSSTIRSGHRMTLIDRVRRTLKRHHLATSTTRVSVALSGGPDSMVLLHALVALRDEGALQLAGVAHMNHQLRDAADADAHFCEAVASSLGLP